MTADAAAALARLGLATLPALAQALNSRPQDARRQLSQLLGSQVRTVRGSISRQTSPRRCDSALRDHAAGKRA